MKKISYNNIDEIILLKVPEFEDKYYESIEYGKDLKHIIFGDLTDFFINTYKESMISKSDKKIKIVNNILDLMEFILEKGDEKSKDLVITSFLENLHNAEKYYEAIKEILRPRCREFLNVIEDEL